MPGPGRLDAAIRWAQESGLRPDDEPTYPQEGQYLTLLRVLIARGRDDPGSLRRRLGFNRPAAAGGGVGARMGSVIEILILQALALRARRDRAGHLRRSKRTFYSRKPKATSVSLWTRARRWKPCSRRSSRRGARDPVTHATRYARLRAAVASGVRASTPGRRAVRRSGRYSLL